MLIGCSYGAYEMLHISVAYKRNRRLS